MLKGYQMSKASNPVTEPDTTGVIDVWLNPGADMGFAELAQHFASAGDLVDSRTLTGDGFVHLGGTKGTGDVLVGVPMILTDWRSVPGDYADAYFTITAVLQRPIYFEGEHVSKVRFNDSGQGIPPVLNSLTPPSEGGKVVLCKKGLRKSEYTKEIAGKTVEAVTYYLA